MQSLAYYDYLRWIANKIESNTDVYLQAVDGKGEKNAIIRFKFTLLDKIQIVKQTFPPVEEETVEEETVEEETVEEDCKQEFTPEYFAEVDKAMAIFANRILKEIEYIGTEKYLSLAASEAFRNIQEAIKEFLPKRETRIYRIGYQYDDQDYKNFVVIVFENGKPIEASKVFETHQEAFDKATLFVNHDTTLFFFKTLQHEFIFVQTV